MSQDYQNPQNQSGQTIIINQPENKTNGMGIAGFIIALVSIFLGWIPILGWIMWLLGLIFSIIGVLRTPRGLAIAGIVISVIGLILLITVFGAILASDAIMS